MLVVEIWKAHIQNDLLLGLRYVAKSQHRLLALIEAIGLPERFLLFSEKTLCNDVRNSSAGLVNVIDVVGKLSIDISRSHHGYSKFVFEIDSSWLSFTVLYRTVWIR